MKRWIGGVNKDGECCVLLAKGAARAIEPVRGQPGGWETQSGLVPEMCGFCTIAAKSQAMKTLNVLKTERLKVGHVLAQNQKVCTDKVVLISLLDRLERKEWRTE
jgi:hypothetical protein